MSLITFSMIKVNLNNLRYTEYTDTLEGLMASVNSSPDYIRTMGIENDETTRGGIVASYYCGSLFGSFIGGWSGDKFGRIKTVVLGCIWGIVGATLQTAAMNTPWMICSRIITGVATGYLQVSRIYTRSFFNHLLKY